jgi:hypothetical protein
MRGQPEGEEIMRRNEIPNRTRAWLVALMLALVAGGAGVTVLGQTTEPPGSSPDGLWQVLDEVDLPPRFSAPTAFVALSLDAGLLETLLADAPRETFGPIPPHTQIWLPLAAGGFAQVAVAQSQLMEPALASQFPEIKTYVFSGGENGIAGQFALGPNGLHASAQTPVGVLKIDPVETAAGRVYLSYLDRDRTDGANDFEHTDDRTEPEPEPVPAPPPALAQALAPTVTALTAGQNLRIYRLAASTTGEFYQARDTGNGLVDVVSSLVADLAGANAILEPEVSVRLILAAASLDVIYDDPNTDPFDNTAAPCDLRNDNRDNMKAVLDDGDYDLGFLFATKSGGGAGGCAWYVVCLTTNDTLHKARGAGQMGNNGTNSASGLLAHEGGHMLGAHHTFSGQAGGCTMNEFNAQHAYEPGSGSTIMSYRGNCADKAGDPPPPPPPPLQNDNVDTSPPIGAGSYYHGHSFDEIVTNVFMGDGATCGQLVNTGNQPPIVDAGPDYTIPRQTPFTLVGDGSDDQPLTFTWEQFDAAATQRPIDTDDGTGPIIRSVPPTADATRTIPNLQNILDGTSRRGEILPQVDRVLNFRLTARDNLMGGGGVASDSMVVTVDGDPFFITSPNSGALDAACQEPLTWEVGGGSVAAQVEALFSSDGGQTFATPLTGPIPNDGEDSFTVPCALGGAGRIKLQAVDNIFFDINDQDLTVFNTPPSVSVTTAGGAVDDQCEFTVQFSASASDPCGLNAADVEVELFKAQDNYTLGTPTINVMQENANEVSVTGSVLVSDLLSSPAKLAVSVTATDACGAHTNDAAEAVIVDDTPPEIDVTLDPSMLWPPNHKLVPIHATVVATDNCPGVSVALTDLVSDEPENGVADGDTAPDIADAELGTPDFDFSLRSERAGSGDGRVYTATYTAQDGSDNEATDSATVEVPKSQ